MSRKTRFEPKRDVTLNNFITEKKIANEINTKTIDNLEKIIKEPSKDNIIEAVKTIEEDTRLSQTSKQEILKILQRDFINLFNFENCPNNYEDIKQEIKFLSGLSQYSFMIIAQRLVKVRDEELYKIGGYNSFKDFIDNELNISKRTVYDYIDIITHFEVRPGALSNEFEYTKLRPYIPLLKARNDNIPKDNLREKAINDINIKTREEIIQEANQLKIQYGLIRKDNQQNTLEREIKLLKSKIPKKLKNYEKEIIGDFIDYLENLLKD